ncbi:Las1 [Babesia duncani]|uniref:Las1 n=1 Tax=Babesia duncani TaxID=323732 RepID=A0AAD9PI68_9APIC|nr:Las1 [Babesia duncani]
MGKEINMPESVIKCRQRCTHGELPDLDTLRLAARDFINFLFQRYWIPQHKCINNKNNNEEYDNVSILALYGLVKCSMICQKKIKRVVTISNVTKLKKIVSNKYCKTQASKNGQDILHLQQRLRMFSHWRLKLNVKKVCTIKKVHGKNFLILNNLLKLALRIFEGIINEDFIISALVEYGLYSFKPKRNCLYLVVLFQAVAHLSFNFTTRLVAHLFSAVYKLPDQLNLSLNSIKERAFQVTSIFKSRSVMDVKPWLMLLLQAAHTQNLSVLFTESFISSFGSTGAHKIILVTKFALARISKAAMLLYPCALANFSKSGIVEICRFFKYIPSVNDIDRFLQPGTRWDSIKWNIKVPLEKQDKKSHHRIQKALQNLKESVPSASYKRSNRMAKLKHFLFNLKEPTHCMDMVSKVAGPYLYNKCSK